VILASLRERFPASRLPVEESLRPETRKALKPPAPHRRIEPLAFMTTALVTSGKALPTPLGVELSGRANV
jgi:hypothetical protein